MVSIPGGTVIRTTGRATDERSVFIHVSLSGDRGQTGFIVVVDDRGKVLAGPFRVLGRSDNAMATRRRNPERLSTRPYGDTPVGEYSVPEVFATGTGTNYGERSYGPNGAIRLEGIGGDALTAMENGRSGLLIHGGNLNSNGRLRPTYGCLRVHNSSMKAILRALDGSLPEKITVVEDEPPPIPDLPPVPKPVPGAKSIEESGEVGEYLANRRTRQVHSTSDPCAWVALMNPENRERVAGLAEGYSWCSHCYA